MSAPGVYNSFPILATTQPLRTLLLRYALSVDHIVLYV